jgi:hypothetical protein
MDHSSMTTTKYLHIFPNADHAARRHPKQHPDAHRVLASGPGPSCDRHNSISSLYDDHSGA